MTNINKENNKIQFQLFELKLNHFLKFDIVAEYHSHKNLRNYCFYLIIIQFQLIFNSFRLL